MTLLETLLACSLLALLLLSASAVHVRALEASEVGREVAHRNLLVELAGELLHYHLGLAGHRGLEQQYDIGGAALTLERGNGSGSDAITVRYLEEWWYDDPAPVELRFDAGRDGAGRWNLYLREPGSTRQPAVERVAGLKVSALLLADGTWLSAAATLPQEIVALEVRLDFDWGESRSHTIGFGRVVRLVEEGS